MAKLIATELAEKVATQCLQFYGGYGFMDEYPMARMYRDVRVGTIGGGSSEIMREIIAKMVIDDVNYESASKSTVKRRSKETATKDADVASISSEESFQIMLSNVTEKLQQTPAIGSTLKFDFNDQQIYIDGKGASNQVSHQDHEADCSIKLSMEHFKSLLSGNLNPMGAVMSGKIKIDGDMGVAMKLQSIFS